MNPDLKTRLLSAATRPYRAAGFSHYCWARGKLSGDAIFASVLDEGLLPSNAQIADLGCGRGLLAAWLLAAEQVAQAGEWAADCPPPPHGLHFRGSDLNGRDIAAASLALQQAFPQRTRFIQEDMCKSPLHGTDVVVILDALHYIDTAAQEALLDHIRAALPPGGLFLTRVGNAGSGWRFDFSAAVDRAIALARGLSLPRLWCRPVDAWVAALEQRGFVVSAAPMNGSKPFSNVMLLAQIPRQPPGPYVTAACQPGSRNGGASGRI